GHRYRVYAIGDVYRNKVYDPGVDAFGIPTGDALLDSSVTSGMYIRMSPPTDTVKPELQDVEIVDSFHIRAHFSEAIDSDDVHARNFNLSSPSSARGEIVGAFRESPEKKPSQITLVTSNPLAPNHEYTLEAIRDSIHDLSRNSLSDSAYKVKFTTPATLRSATPPTFITMGIRDSARNISALPSFPISFSDAVLRDSLEHAVTLRDTGHHLIRTIFHWYDDARVYLTPVDSLLSNVFYLVTIRTSGIQSPITLIGLSAKDTLLHFHFQTANVREFGKISGTITIADSFFAQNPSGALVVQVLQGGSVAAQKILPHGEKKFEFNQIPTATYRVRAYFSRDGSGVYDPGSVQPWRFGVPTGEYPKEFDARPRWTIANIDFEVK
ncbi:MAG TPA: Ig-like domain-containing protein, partial [Candidatus Kapabacteria bacterium]|nr:Ig-like domain-containing protein [Candidatus Kapabacteria bacterium]